MEVFEDGLEQRYIFVSQGPTGQQSVIGYLEGFESLEQLKGEMAHTIEYNKEHGYPTWVVKREIVEKLV
tara:strand:- start:2889 stop:3095 length:207 start_codon:yes stop_codon:yes gene_type:complete